MKRGAIVFCAVIMLSANAKQVMAKDKFSNRFSVEVIGGQYRLPGALFSMDKSIVEHPGHLVGEISGIRGNYALNDYWLLGATWFKASASGNGNWARSDTASTLAENGVAGVISGKTNMDLDGVTFDVERRFLKVKSLMRPYIRGGLGVGEFTIRFNGQFIGYENQSGFNLPITEDASDMVKKTIPVVSAEAGLRFFFAEYLSINMALFWNTGHGMLIGGSLRF